MGHAQPAEITYSLSKNIIYPAKNRPAKTPTQTAAKPEIVVPTI